MQSTVEPLEGNKVKVSVEVEEAEFEAEVDAAFRRIAREARIPGFRPGKVPRRILEARVGTEAARADALQHSLPDYYAGVTRLGLAHGDTTGQWMLEYRFPYDSAPVQQAVRGLATAIGKALDAAPSEGAGRLRAVVDARDMLRGRLTAADYRYFEFQLWQEGVARFIEYAASGAAAELEKPAAAFQRLSDYEPYSAAAAGARRRLRRELEHLELGRERRVAFYSLGAAIALLLEETRPDWKQAYEGRPFALPELLTAGR